MRSLIGRTMLRDRHRLERRLRGAMRREPDDLTLAKIAKAAGRSAEVAAGRAASVPAVEYPEELPVSQKKDEIADAIRDHQVVVVCGETGSGKTTQLPKICLEAGRGVYGTIGHTQPRRIAARTVAARVAEEIGRGQESPRGVASAGLGRSAAATPDPFDLVGYKVRFNDQTSPQTLVKLMTDGILLAETQGDKFLGEYDTIIVDEAHERSLNIDFLLGHLRNLLEKRPELKVVVTSATIDPARFSDHFGGRDRCPVINVTGRTYPVEVRYRPLFDDGVATRHDREGVRSPQAMSGSGAGDADGRTSAAPIALPHGRASSRESSRESSGEAEDVNDAIVAAVDELGRDPTVGRGDTLVFLSGEREIREAAKALSDHVGGRHGHYGAYDVLPLYARLSNAEQNRVFKPSGRRRIVLATNVAETSLTVPGIRSVIDAGVARVSRYSPRSKVQRLPIEPVSQASADQRKGRCGRLGPGVCVRLYAESDFEQRPEFTDPEIQRTNLAAVILQMEAFGLGAVESFPFIDPPDPRQVRDGYQTLQEIGALDEHKRLTDVGRVLSRMPIDPKLARMVLAAAAEDCLDEMVIIAAGLSIQDPRERPMEKAKEADEAHLIWKAGGSDFLTLVNLWRWYARERRERSRNKLRQECKSRYLNYLRMMEWGDVQRQLREAVAGLASSAATRHDREGVRSPQAMPGTATRHDRKQAMSGEREDGTRLTNGRTSASPIALPHGRASSRDPSDPPDLPAYFITFTTKGTRLHGDPRGSVDRDHNTPGEAFVSDDPDLLRIERDQSAGPAVALEETARRATQDAIVGVCEHRGWTLHALHVRTTHVHAVVSAGEVPPERVMNDFKGYATRRMRERGVAPGDTIWTRHGSTRWINEPATLEARVAYTVDEQGAAMEPVPVDARGTATNTTTATATRHDREGVRSPQAMSGSGGADDGRTSASPIALPDGRASSRSPLRSRWRLNPDPATGDQVHRAVLPGLLGNVGKKGDANEYDGVRGRKFFLFPGSVTFGSKPQWVVSAELVETTRLYARTACSVKPEWVEEAAGDLVKKTYGEPFWQMKTGRVVAPMKVSLWGLQVAKRPVDYGKIDPKKSRSIFIKSALVDADMESGAAFFRHNKQLVRDVELLEAKTRRRDLMVDPATQFAFYDARLPASVVDQRSFERWRGTAEKGDRRLLFMRPEDLMARPPGDADGGQFPDVIETNGVELPLTYRFDPGHVADGATADVQLSDLHVVDADRLDWLVPGLIEEKVVDLIRTLPKSIRTNFVPVPEFAHRAVIRLPFGEGNLVERLARHLANERGVTVTAGDFRPGDLSDYLKLNLRVLDDTGKPVGYGRDVRELRKRLKVQARAKLADLPDPTWNRDHIVAWDVGDLPERVEIKVRGRGVQGFPALIDRGESVSLRLLETPEAARAAHRRGVRRLLLLDYKNELRHQINDLRDLRQMELMYAPIGNAKRLRETLAEAVGDALFLGEDPADVRTAAAFEERVNAAWAKLGETVRGVAATASDVLARRHKVELALDRPVPDILTASVADMRDQLAHLVPADFLLETPPAWLPHVPRYLAGIEHRLAKLMNAGLDKDSRAATAVFPYWKAYLDRVADPDAGPLSRAWVDFRWLIEEYRVSLFAQPLGTAAKVSDKVLGDRLARLFAL